MAGGSQSPLICPLQVLKPTGGEIYLIHSKYLKSVAMAKVLLKSYILLKSLPTHIPFIELGVCNCHKRGIVDLQVTVTSQTYPTPE